MKNVYDENGYNPPDEEVAFRVNYNPTINPYISVNGHLISRPHFTSDVSEFFQYIYDNPNRLITSEEIDKKAKVKLKKGMDDVLRDLGFRKELAQIFFKEMTNKQVYFRNPVNHGHLKNMEIDMNDIYKTTFTPKRKTAKYPTT